MSILTTRPSDPQPNIAAAGSISSSASEGGATGRAERNRQRMLERVHHFWIEGVLNQSLYHIARIELGLAEAPERIELPWKLMVEHPERAPWPLPDGTPMHAVFDQFDQTLLVLGAPGSGKTTLLLALARDLIERAKQDPQYPIPVVFNLSSWALRRPSLEAWLVDELSARYDVPRWLAARWVEHQQVLPLLDGLDEVALKHRSACVEAINAFHKAHGFVPLAVCSRAADYEALTPRLRLAGAVTIQPLTRPQVDEYLRRAGTALSGVSAALRQDETLWELLDSPLMLSILTLAYQMPDVQIARIKGTLEARRAALFEAYIKAMFKRREASSPYTPQQTRHWLSWLAQAMVRYNQTVFYLERLQPGWMPKAQARLHGIGSGLVGGLLFGLDKGGVAYIQHGVLRLLLWRYDYAPLHYVKFLDQAAAQLFLRKVGGGYIFVHRLLMEHFLELAAQAATEP